MNRLISRLWTKQLRQVLANTCIGVLFLVITSLGIVSGDRPAFAESVTPEARSYQVDQSSDSRTRSEQTKARSEAADNNGGGLLENVREKLNLDEPLPESTKDFFKQIKGEPVEIEEPRPSGKGEIPQNH
ncbi:MAG: hypothetical protein SFY66_13920 [Oculatellaceae cyanobacterium bins.114]|nr:hypothetical protein [Oculatellaceae cyanobacterium bins.114]